VGHLGPADPGGLFNVPDADLCLAPLIDQLGRDRKDPIPRLPPFLVAGSARGRDSTVIKPYSREFPALPATHRAATR
jgi:hypothetical protein